jgi:haloacetate dehalogenase
VIEGVMVFPGFEVVDVEVGGLRSHARVAGSGPAVLLLHGYPQTHVMWHQVAPVLAREHTVVVADLRGYGDSAKPAAGADHAEYCKRSMAGDQVALMAMLGFDVFAAVGHDRGGRVVHRMCLDHPDVVTRAAVLDIVPTRHVFATADQHVGLAYYHWFFLAQPADLPERLIGGDPEYFLRRTIHQWSATENPFGDVAVEEYVRCFRDPAAIAASCEDYRAATTIDLEHDEQSVRAGHRVTCPLLVLWGLRSFVGRHYDVLSVWRSYAHDVRGSGIDCGHFLAEEQPQATSVALSAFLEGDV